MGTLMKIHEYTDMLVDKNYFKQYFNWKRIFFVSKSIKSLKSTFKKTS